MMSLSVNLIGLLLIATIIWWFWLSKRKVIASTTKNNFIEIKVKDGAYQPAYIETQLNKPITLRFIREDASPCAENVIFGSLNISEFLPLHKPTNIDLVIKKAGEYEFTCQMGMYRGKLIVKD